MAVQVMTHMRTEFLDDMFRVATAMVSAGKFSPGEFVNVWQGYARLAAIYRPLNDVANR